MSHGPSMISFGLGARLLLLFGCLAAATAPAGLGAGLQVRVTPVTGDPYTAELNGIRGDAVTLASGDEPRSVPKAEISRLERTDPASITGPSLSVALANGSRLKAEGITMEGPEAKIQLRRQPELVVPISQLQWIRYRPPSPAVDQAWLGLLGDERAGDVLVIRRSSDTIDQISGVVVAADATTVRFTVGDREVPAPVAKLEGILFRSNQQPQEQNATTWVVDTLGSQWAVASLEMSSPTELRMELPGGIERTLPLEQVEAIRFEGNTQWLVSEAPAELQYVPLIQLPVAPEQLLQWLGPRVDRDRDLVLRSRSSITFRVDPKFSTFASRIVSDPSVAAGGGAVVRVLVDGKVAWSETVLPADEPRGVELKLENARRITLEVDYGEGEARSDAGDVIRFVEPRLLQ